MTKPHLTLRRRLHAELLERLKFEALEALPREDLAAWLRRRLNEILLRERSTKPSRMEREMIIEFVLDEIIGLGPLECLLRDPEVIQVLVGDDLSVRVIRRERMIKTTVEFDDVEHLAKVVERAVDQSRRRGTLRQSDDGRFWGALEGGLEFCANPVPGKKGGDILHIERIAS